MADINNYIKSSKRLRAEVKLRLRHVLSTSPGFAASQRLGRLQGKRLAFGNGCRRSQFPKVKYRAGCDKSKSRYIVRNDDGKIPWRSVQE